MKKPSKLSLKISHAIAKRIKANQAQRAGVFAFKEEVPKTQRKSSSISKALSKGAFVVGGLAMSPVVLQAWAGTVYWISGSHNLNSQHNILGYMSSNSFSQKTTWQWSWGSHNVYNKFYYHSGGGIDGYYCTNWDCNGSVTLVGNQAGTYTLHQLQYNGGDLNLQINGSGGSGELSIGGGGGSPPNVNITSYYGTHFTDNWNAQSVSIANTLSVNQTTLTTHGNHGTTSNNATIEGSSSATININDASYENFQNTTFSTENGSSSTNINFDSNNITFDHVTYDGGVHSTIADNGSLTFSNNSQFTLGQNSPFTNLGSNVNLSGVTFNINQTLNVGDTYNLLHTSKSINYNSYTSHLWDLIHYDGVTGSLDNNGYTNPSGGNGLYHVSYEINGKQYIFGETFSNNTMGVQFITYKGPPQSIWDGVYNLSNNQNYNVGSGVGYIDPGTGTAQTWSSGGGSFGASLDQGTGGTLVIGNKTETPNTQGKILFGGTGIHSGDVGYITGSFKAQNIYLTSTIESGNAWATGGGTSITYTATKQITMDGLHYLENKAGSQRSNAYFSANNGAISVSNSSFTDNTEGSGGIGGVMQFDSKNTSFTNTQFSGNQNQIALTGTQSLTLTNTQLNNGISTINLTGNTLSMSCDGKNGSCAPNFSQNPPLGASGINAEHLLVTANNATFSNTTLNLDPVSGANAYFQTNDLTFDNDTFSGNSSFSFNANGGAQKTTFEGTTTLDTTNQGQATSPFGTYAGNVGFGSQALLNLSNTQEILQALQGGTYTLLSGKNIDYASDTTYAKNLWQMVQFGGQSAGLATTGLPQGVTQGQNGIYYVSLDGQTIEENFGAKSLTLSLIDQKQDVWYDVYTMTPTCLFGLCGHKTYNPNVGTNGIAYIDPTHPEAEGWNGSNTLSTYTGGGNGMNLQVQGSNNTLVIGNDIKQAATGGVVRLGGTGGSG
ncbi:vacuolating cytotoxin domain-containing protein, partial [Helicobacter ailurogastricus]|uniref:vacuolating cytotoxin domain-containing protein n=1 Tax=Helicobacter ailurogastricus TaxID=1578720 RepID=UPI002554FED9